MRILVFSTDDFLYPAGGAETAMGEIMKRMPDVTFDLICAKLRPRVSSFEKINNVNIYRIGVGIPKIDGYILALYGYRKAKQLIGKHAYDLVWSIMASYAAFIAVKVKERHDVPFLLTLQEGDSFEHIKKRTKFISKKFRNIFASADGLQAISTYLLHWGESMGFRGKKKKVIPNGVDIANFTQQFSEKDTALTRKQFGFSEDAVVLVTASRLVPKNGVSDIVFALPRLPEHICLVICGTGMLEKEIRAQVARLGLQKRVLFLGFVKHTELPIILAASDIFIRPSVSEGLGNAFLEAMAAKKLVIGTPVGGIPDFLVDGKTGFMCEPKHPLSLAKTIERITNLSPETYINIVNAAYDMVIRTYDWDAIVKDMRTLFLELRK